MVPDIARRGAGRPLPGRVVPAPRLSLLSGGRWVTKGFHALPRPLHFSKNRLGMPQQHHACFRQRAGPPASPDQPGFQVALQSGDRMADRRLREPQQTARLRKAAHLRQRIKRQQLLAVDRFDFLSTGVHRGRLQIAKGGGAG